MPTHCREGLVTMAANGARSGRGLINWLVLLFKLMNSSAVCGEFVVEQREALRDKQSETEFSVCTEHCPSDPAVADSRCNTIKLEPTWTREYLYSQQVADPSFKMIIQFKEASATQLERRVLI